MDLFQQSSLDEVKVLDTLTKTRGFIFCVYFVYEQMNMNPGTCWEEAGCCWAERLSHRRPAACVSTWAAGRGRGRRACSGTSGTRDLLPGPRALICGGENRTRLLCRIQFYVHTLIKYHLNLLSPFIIPLCFIYRDKDVDVDIFEIYQDKAEHLTQTHRRRLSIM